MPMYKLIEYSDNYLKTSGIFWQYCRDQRAIYDTDYKIVDFNADNTTTDSFKIKQKNNRSNKQQWHKNAKIMVPLKYLSMFWRTLEMPLFNCDTNLNLNCSKNCVIVVNNADQDTTFSITDTKFYISVVTLSTQDNAKLLEQLKSGFKRTINWKKYQSKVSTERQNQYLDDLIDPSFQGVNSLFVLSFEDETERSSYKRHYLSTVEIKKL